MDGLRSKAEEPAGGGREYKQENLFIPPVPAYRRGSVSLVYMKGESAFLDKNSQQIKKDLIFIESQSHYFTIVNIVDE